MPKSAKVRRKVPEPEKTKQAEIPKEQSKTAKSKYESAKFSDFAKGRWAKSGLKG